MVPNTQPKGESNKKLCNIVTFILCSVPPMSVKYFFFKRLPWELCVIFNVKLVLESSYHKNGHVKIFKYLF